jgi:hypothetical protein
MLEGIRLMPPLNEPFFSAASADNQLAVQLFV